MSRKGFRCPNCDSEYCSAILWWKSPKKIVKGTFDAYKCHDCQQLSEAGTNRKVTEGYFARKDVKVAQPDLFGNVDNISDTIADVPKLVESPAGLSVSVVRIPAGSTKQYRKAAMQMMSEINRTSSGRVLPQWYKYRNIKRGTK